jgi:hypothetical protein
MAKLQDTICGRGSIALTKLVAYRHRGAVKCPWGVVDVVVGTAQPGLRVF